MPVTRKRTSLAPEGSKQTRSTANQKSVREYGGITKSQKANGSAKKQKSLEGRSTQLASALASQAKDVTREPVQPALTETIPKQLQAPEQVIATRTSKKRARDEPLETPQTKRFKNALPPTPAETPSRAASRLFDKLSITPKKDGAALYETPPLTPKSSALFSDTDAKYGLPAGLQDIIRLFSSFIVSVSLWYAHHGNASPMYLRAFLPQVAKAWKKRAVTEEDVRKLVAILDRRQETFRIVDDGEGRLCLEQAGDRASGHFNQPELTDMFTQEVQKLWADWPDKKDVSGFVDKLPLAAIARNEFAPAPNSKPTKGQSLLRDFKKSVEQARADHTTSQQIHVPTAAKSAAAVFSRGTSLLDRILAKQELNSTRGAGPTQEELDRRTALDRIEEISLVLDLLAGTRPRVSFSMQMMVSHLQNSLRNPIATDDVERCLKLMAGEITPSFVTMIQAGQVRGVVITKGGRPSIAELRERLERTRS